MQTFKSAIVRSRHRFNVPQWSSPTFIGDANLDGNVNSSGHTVVGVNWLEDIAVDGWGLGDFNGDGVVDALDLNELGQNWLATNGN